MPQFLIYIIVLLLQSYPTAYMMTNTPPQADMRPLGAINITMLFVENGQWVPHCLASTIEAYVIWVNPPRPPMYSIRSGRYWGVFDDKQLAQIECDHAS